VHPRKIVSIIFARRNRPAAWRDGLNYTPTRQVRRPYNVLEMPEWVVPWCTVVAGQIDLCSGGKGVIREDPDEKAKTLIDRGLPQ